VHEASRDGAASAGAGRSTEWAVADGSSGGAKVGDAGVKTGEGGGRTADVTPEDVSWRSMVGWAGSDSKSSWANCRIRRRLRLFELLARPRGRPSAAASGGGGAVEDLGARGTKVGAGAAAAAVPGGRRASLRSADVRGAGGEAGFTVGSSGAMRGGTPSGAGVVPARAERRLSRQLRRSLTALGGLGATACWIPSASVRAPKLSASAGEGSGAVEDDGNER
jgi:hypothetical protein